MSTDALIAALEEITLHAEKMKELARAALALAQAHAFHDLAEYQAKLKSDCYLSMRFDWQRQHWEVTVEHKNARLS